MQWLLTWDDSKLFYYNLFREFFILKFVFREFFLSWHLFSESFFLPWILFSKHFYPEFYFVLNFFYPQFYLITSLFSWRWCVAHSNEHHLLIFSLLLPLFEWVHVEWVYSWFATKDQFFWEIVSCCLMSVWLRPRLVFPLHCFKVWGIWHYGMMAKWKKGITGNWWMSLFQPILCVILHWGKCALILNVVPTCVLCQSFVLPEFCVFS